MTIKTTVIDDQTGEEITASHYFAVSVRDERGFFIVEKHFVQFEGVTEYLTGVANMQGAEISLRQNYAVTNPAPTPEPVAPPSREPSRGRQDS